MGVGWFTSIQVYAQSCKLIWHCHPYKDEPNPDKLQPTKTKLTAPLHSTCSWALLCLQLTGSTADLIGFRLLFARCCMTVFPLLRWPQTCPRKWGHWSTCKEMLRAERRMWVALLNRADDEKVLDSTAGSWMGDVCGCAWGCSLLCMRIIWPALLFCAALPLINNAGAQPHTDL